MFFEDLVSELSTTLSVGSLLFFVAVYVVVSLRTFRRSADDLDARARMALDPPSPEAPADDRWTDVRGNAAARG